MDFPSIVEDLYKQIAGLKDRIAYLEQENKVSPPIIWRKGKFASTLSIERNPYLRGHKEAMHLLSEFFLSS